jgi:hypothetical protein
MYLRLSACSLVTGAASSLRSSRSVNYSPRARLNVNRRQSTGGHLSHTGHRERGSF